MNYRIIKGKLCKNISTYSNYFNLSVLCEFEFQLQLNWNRYRSDFSSNLVVYKCEFGSANLKKAER